MKRICKHLEHIYQGEIARGNSLVRIFQWDEFFCVIFKNKEAEYELDSDISSDVEKDYRFPYARGYTCDKCKCVLFFPALKNMVDRCYYFRDNSSKKQDNNGIIATPENIEMSDEVWQSWIQKKPSVIPKIVGFVDRYDENT
jgi:hypothetical protein